MTMNAIPRTPRPTWCRKETAHIELGHVEDMTEYLEHRGLMETEAESVAYVVAGMLGIDTSAYSIGYIGVSC